MVEAILILELSATRVIRIARPFRKDKDDILLTRGDPFAKLVLRDCLANIVAPAVQINEHVYLRGAAKPARNEQANSAVRVMGLARKCGLAVFEPLLPA